MANAIPVIRVHILCLPPAISTFSIKFDKNIKAIIQLSIRRAGTAAINLLPKTSVIISWEKKERKMAMGTPMMLKNLNDFSYARSKDPCEVP